MDKMAEQISIQVEELAETVLIGRQQLVDYDRRKNTNREALSALKKFSPEQKVWMSFGDIFIKLPQPTTKKILEENQQRIQAESDKLRLEIKEKAKLLTDMEEREDERHGWDSLSRLKPLSRSDMNMLANK